jgi:hypothetical protein
LGYIFHKFNTFGKKLQSVDIDLNVAVELYQSLIKYFGDIFTDNCYKSFKKNIEKCGIMNF